MVQKTERELESEARRNEGGGQGGRPGQAARPGRRSVGYRAGTEKSQRKEGRKKKKKTR